ncbi:MAG: hypothetical protein MHM6MM_007165, partial [Cercozoa sp. M6MM]
GLLEWCAKRPRQARDILDPPGQLWRNGFREWLELSKQSKQQQQQQHQKQQQQQQQLQQRFEDLFRRICAAVPLRLADWFLARFGAEARQWYAARQRYARSLAAWSVVGYVIGLGDRHCENILFDVETGEVLHIDYDSLFDVARGLQVPETMPFRLTRNFVAALGVCDTPVQQRPGRVFGTFRNVCIQVLSLLRERRDTLTHVLQSFAHDPLLDWRKHEHRTGGVEREAREVLSRVACRLEGRVACRHGSRFVIEKPAGAPLSVEGHVDLLIRNATDEALLATMYYGWMPFL